MASYTYTDLNIAGSTAVRPRSINESGDVAGFYFDVSGQQHGFSDIRGVVTTIDVPGATSTSVSDINASGEMTGTYDSSDANTGYQAFIDVGGSLQAIVIPRAVNVQASAINDAGQVVGAYTDINYMNGGTYKQLGFLYDNGKSTAISYPGATATYCYYINNRGQVIGYYQDSSDVGHYFLYNAGSYYPISVPGSAYTAVAGLNDLGQVAGTFSDGVTRYGFVESDGVYTTFGVPGATNLDVTGINNAGEVTGDYDDASNHSHPFVEKGGIVTVLDDARHPDGVFFAINDAGEVVGSTTSNDATTAFTAVLTPPTISGTAANQATTNAGPIAPFATATLVDPNGSTETLTISLSGGGGTLTGAGLTANPNGTYTLTGSAADVTRRLDALQFAPTGTGAAGSSNTTRFTLSDVTDIGTATSDAATTVIDTISAAPAPNPGPSPLPAGQDTVSLSPQVTYSHGVFTLAGTASSAAGVGSVEITATVDGVATDLGAATVDGNGNFVFSDLIGRASQGFITATSTDRAGVTASAAASYALDGGLGQGGFRARQTSYTPDGSDETATTLFRRDGSRRTNVQAAGQTFTSDSFDTFRNHGTPDTTFVFVPGHGLDTVGQFRVDGADHDTLSFTGADFGSDAASQIAGVLRNASDGPGGVTITDPTSGDTVKLTGITRQQLADNRGDFAFHA